LVPYITSTGDYGFWTLRKPNDAKDFYAKSALAIVQSHAGQWIKVGTNKRTKSFVVTNSRKATKLPVWIKGGRKELMRIAFSTMTIDTLDHPFLQQLRGEDLEGEEGLDGLPVV
jgi:hypothetical protein